jgi:hypothetical protein
MRLCRGLSTSAMRKNAVDSATGKITSKGVRAPRAL